MPVCKICGSKKVVSFSGDGVEYPVFLCPNCGPDPVNEWEKWFEKYSSIHEDPANWDKKKHHVACVVGSFCQQFFDFYGYPYRFSYRSPIPYKDKAFTMARRLLAMFDGNAKMVRNYIRWIFQIKVRNTGYQVTSLGFFVSEKFQQEYNQARSRAAVLRRTTPLPRDFIRWCEENVPEIFKLRTLNTWNDLNGCVSHIKYKNDESDVIVVIREAVKRGMLPPGPGYRKLEN